jgi:hypothetical protein
VVHEMPDKGGMISGFKRKLLYFFGLFSKTTVILFLDGTNS